MSIDSILSSLGFFASGGGAAASAVAPKEGAVNTNKTKNAPEAPVTSLTGVMSLPLDSDGDAFSCCGIEDAYCLAGDGKKDGNFGVVAGFTHNAMKAAVLLASNMKIEELNKWVVAGAEPKCDPDESGIVEYTSSPELVTFDRVCHVDDSIWTGTDATVRVCDMRHLMSSVDIDGADMVDHEDDQHMIFSAVQTLAMEGWDNRKVFYFGAAFYRMVDGFRDGKSETFFNIVRERLAGPSSKKLYCDGVLALVYAFAPTKLQGEGGSLMNPEDEAKWVSEQLIHLGEITGQPDFAKVLVAGYALHRMNDILDELRAPDANKDASYVQTKKDAAKKLSDALFNVIGHTDAYNKENSLPCSSEAQKLYDALKVPQREFVNVMRERGESILAALDKIEGQACELGPKDCKPRQDFDADTCACVDKPPRRQPVQPRPPRPQPTATTPPPPTATTPPPANTGKTIPNPF
jgi:hypothetical protein